MNSVSALPVVIDSVVKRFGEFTAVDGVSLTIEPGTCYALLGPNGAGKSTLSRIIAGVSPASGGDVSVFGLDPWARPTDVRTRVGVVGQEDALDDELNVISNLRVYGGFFGLRGAEFRARVDALLRFMELEARAEQVVAALSGGMRRRLVVARALLNQPDLLLLDEPTTGLDPQVRHAIWAVLRQLRAQGMTILLTTHYMEEAAQLADRVGILHKGKLVAEGGADELVRAHLPAHVLETESAALSEEPPAEFTVERHGDRVFVFYDDQERLLEWAAHAAPGRTLARRASLEDVFLELTGRSLDGS